MLTVKDVAERLNCSVYTVYQLIKSCKLKAYRCSGWRVREEDLAEYLESAKNRPVVKNATGRKVPMKYLRA